MKITVSVEDPTTDFQDRLLTLLAEHAADVQIDTEWSVERATRYYLSLPPNAQRIVKEAVIRDGYVPADELREDGDGSLRGHSPALKRALERGVRKGWWPQGMDAPIQPQGPGFGKVKGYLMPGDLVGLFLAAVHDADATVNEGTQIDSLAKTITGLGGVWDTNRAVTALHDAGYGVDDKRARQILRDLAANGLLTKTADRPVTYTTNGTDNE